MKNQRGLSLVEILIALAILTGCALALALVVNHVNILMQRQQLRWAVDRVTTSLFQLTVLPATIRASLSDSESTQIKNIYYQTRGWLSADHHEAWKPIRLNIPLIEKTGTTFISGGQFTGTRDFPMRYNAKGEMCDLQFAPCPAPLWPIEVFTEYNFSCPPLFSRTYNGPPWRALGVEFDGPLYPTGLVIPAFCRLKTQMNIQLTIRESEDAGLQPTGLFRPIVEIFSIPTRDINLRY